MSDQPLDLSSFVGFTEGEWTESPAEETSKTAINGDHWFCFAEAVTTFGDGADPINEARLTVEGRANLKLLLNAPRILAEARRLEERVAAFESVAKSAVLVMGHAPLEQPHGNFMKDWDSVLEGFRALLQPKANPNG